MAAPGPLVLTNLAKQYIGDATDLLGQAGNYMAALFQSTSNLSTTSDVFGGATNEVANGNGYTSLGFALTGVTFTQSGGVGAFKSSNNPNWTGSGAGFVARWMCIYNSGTLNGHVKPIIGYMLLDSTPADVSFAVGNTVTVTMNAAGWLTLT